MTATTPPNMPAGAREASIPDRQLVRDATGLLRTFNLAGVLGPADVHTARRVADICRRGDSSPAHSGTRLGEPDQLALALTVRALRMGSVCIDLDTIAHSAFDEAEEIIDVSTLPWPEPETWRGACADSLLITQGEDAAGTRPMRMVDGLLYLERYWLQQEQVRTELIRRRTARPPDVDAGRLAAALDRLFGAAQAREPAGIDLQRLAAAVSATHWVTVLAGGPGTGKTTTVARLLALVRDMEPGARVALAAPTGKAAARLEEAVRSSAATLTPEDSARLGEVGAKTIHRLLGWLPDHRSRFRYNADNHLPYDLVVVDEMSMVSLTLMARLMEAVRPDARLVLVGDPDQLSSVEAGAVMADITGAEVADRPEVRRALERVGAPGADAYATQGVVRLTKTWRFGARIGALAAAIRAGDADGVVDLLARDAEPARAGDATDRIEFTEIDLGVDEQSRQRAAVAGLRDEVVAAGTRLHESATRGDIDSALAALEQHRLLCAHRLGPYGVARWSLEVEGWLVDAIPGYAAGDPPGSPWYVGRPVLMNANDYEVQLYNGDTGVAVATPAGLRVAFARGGDPLMFAPVRLDDVQTVHAMTVHRAQGSQFDQVSLILPPVDSPLLTRELLYTAVTRASRVVRIFGSVEAVRRAVRQPADRASGLRARLG